MNERYVHAIWCDDIRQEVGNKPSFMGVYTAGILVKALPIVLPRLGVYVWVKTPIDRPFQKINIRIERSDGFRLLDKPAIIHGELQKIENPKGSDFTRQVLMAGFLLGGIEIPVGCKYFVVFAETESEILEGSRLHIDVNPQIFNKISDYPIIDNHDS